MGEIKKVKITDKDLRRLEKEYPELKRDIHNKLCKKSNSLGVRCKEIRIQGDRYCLKHTEKDLSDYEISWMCEAQKKNGHRCGNTKLIGKTLCQFHYVKSCKSKEELSKAYNNLKSGAREKHNNALRSNNPDDWINLQMMKCENPKDVENILVETINRIRMGTIKLNNARLIANISKSLHTIQITNRELELAKEMDEGIREEEMKEIRNYREQSSNVVSLRDKIRNLTQKNNNFGIVGDAS